MKYKLFHNLVNLNVTRYQKYFHFNFSVQWIISIENVLYT